MTTSTTSTPSALQDPNDADEIYEADNLSGGRINDPPRTPADDHLNAAAPGELSPPRSQSQSEDISVNEAVGQAVPNGNHAGANIRVMRSAARPPADTDMRHENLRDEGSALPTVSNQRDEQPGWAWKNKKTQEDMQRAWDNIVDRDFNIKEYGDVMLQGKGQSNA